MQFTKKMLVAVLLLSSTPAYAQGYAKQNSMVKTDHLQHVEFYHDRVRVGIEDRRPILSDWRRGDSSQPLVIPVPPMPGSGASASVPANAVPVGGNIYVVPSAPGGIGASNPMLGDRSYLQHGGFTSYTPSQPITANRNLPSGTTTGIHGALKPAPSMVSKAPQTLNPVSNRQVMKEWEPAEIAHYTGPNLSVGGQTTLQTKSAVQGRVLNKFLTKQK